MKIIGITGMPGSGKGEFVKIAKQKEIPVVRMGDLVWEEVKKRGLELTSENVGKVANSEREKYGYGIWAERTAEVVKKLTADVVVIDGIRGDAEIVVYKQEWMSDFVLAAVHASPKVRSERILARMRVDDTTTMEKFEERDRRELKWGIGNAIAMADYMIINESVVEDFRAQVEKFFDEL